MLYKKAKQNLNNYDYQAAIKTYEQLTARYPFTDQARQARLDLIYAYYRAGEGESATDAAARPAGGENAPARMPACTLAPGLQTCA